jgi:hypothetical protein
MGDARRLLELPETSSQQQVAGMQLCQRGLSEAKNGAYFA